MKRPCRSLFNIAAAASLFLSLVALCMVPRSYLASDAFGFGRATLESSSGDLMMDYWVSDQAGRGPWFRYDRAEPRSNKFKSLWGVQPALAPIGFAYDVVRDPKWRLYRVMVPLWFAALLGLILPGYWMLA